MTGAADRYALIGGLAAYPRRLVARVVTMGGGVLQRGVTRRTTHVVFGRKLLRNAAPSSIESRLLACQEAGCNALSESGFLRRLGLVPARATQGLSFAAIGSQSGLDQRNLTLLALFDAFEHDAEPFSFRDLILARKYAGLIAQGASWYSIATSVQRTQAVSALTALTLQAERGKAIYAKSPHGLTELDGQALLPVDSLDDELDELLALADEAEEDGRHAEAAELYGRCCAIAPDDATIAFNRGNCLRKAGETDEAQGAYLKALKRDPRFVEAWFNLADMMAGAGKVATARRHFQKAIAIDPAYADAIFNLANLEYVAGELNEARNWWCRYLKLDRTSEWARTAARGIQYVDLHLTHKAAG